MPLHGLLLLLLLLRTDVHAPASVDELELSVGHDSVELLQLLRAESAPPSLEEGLLAVREAALRVLSESEQNAVEDGVDVTEGDGAIRTSKVPQSTNTKQTTQSVPPAGSWLSVYLSVCEPWCGVVWCCSCVSDWSTVLSHPASVWL